MPTAQVSADMREMRGAAAIAQSGTYLATTSVPGDSIEMWKAQIAALPVRKRKNWKGSMIDRFGVRGGVVYDPQGIEVPGYGRTYFKQRMNEQKKSMYGTAQEWLAAAGASGRVEHLPLSHWQRRNDGRTYPQDPTRNAGRREAREPDGEPRAAEPPDPRAHCAG